MRKTTLLFVLLSIIILLQYGCTKEMTTNDSYIIAEYYPENKESVKNEALSFLSFTTSATTNTNKSDTDFQDSDPNEGSWLMEASSNYLVNVNIALKTDTVIELVIGVENFLNSEKKIKMRGTSMVSTFNQLHFNLSSIQESLGKLTRLIDYQIIGVSSSQTTIQISAFLGSIENEGSGNQSFPDDISPLTLFNDYETELLMELGGSPDQFYTNITYWGLSPYVHIWDVNDPNYWPEQDPASPLYNPVFPRCGTNNGQTDCRVCYDCLWSQAESTFLPYNSSTGSWSSAQADYYYEGTRTVIENFINNGSYESALLSVDVEYNFFPCGCPNEAWEQVTMNLGVGNNY